jgi:dihydroorotase
LVGGVHDGTIDVLVSDHRPEDDEGKKLEFDRATFGIIGIQEMGSLLQMISEHVPLEILLESITTRPRELLGLELPSIEKGKQAVLTLFDPGKKWRFDEKTNQSNSRNSPFYGRELTGKVVAVFNNGKVHLDRDLKIN